MTYAALPSVRTYAVLGTGALGGFYGARLQQAGADVHFLLRSDYAHVHRHGLVIESPDGDVTLPHVNAYQRVEDMPRCDVVIVALKTTQNAILPKLLPAVMHANSVVLVLQNGIGIEAEVAQWVGSDRVLGGLCFLCSNKVGDGHIRHLDYKHITMGDYAPHYAPCGVTSRLDQIASDFERAGIPIERSPDLFLARWKKLVWNIPFNGLSVVLNATTTEMMTQPIRDLVKQLMTEVVQGAAACTGDINRTIPTEFIQTMLDYTAKMTPYRTSMKIDYDEQRPLEIEAIVGNPLRLAQQAGLHLPQIHMLYQQLTFLDQRREVAQRSC